MSAIHILITRAKPQADNTAIAVAKLGCVPIVLPLSEIVACDFNFSSPPFKFDALIASSANAFNMLEKFADKKRDEGKKLEQFVEPSKIKTALERFPKAASHFSENVLEKKLFWSWSSFHGMPLYCIGSKTAEAARRIGFHNIIAITDAAENLSRILTNTPMQRFLYLASKYRRPFLENTLRNRGKEVTILEIYNQRPLIPNISRLNSQLEHKNHSINMGDSPIILPKHFDFVLFYSAMAVRQFVQHIPIHFVDHRTKFLCLSARIAKQLPQHISPQSVIPIKSNEASLLDKLDFLLQSQ